MKKYRNKELSWLSFNGRVLQEATDPTVPLLERLKFLGIFSSNLDEFFRVRVATLKRLAELEPKASKKLIGDNPRKVLTQLSKIVIEQQAVFEKAYQSILGELDSNGIRIVDERQLTKEQSDFVTRYFQQRVRPALAPIMLGHLEHFPEVRDHAIYLAVHLDVTDRRSSYALIEVPSDVLGRFVALPSDPGTHTIMLLDDVIRHNLTDLFSVLRPKGAEAYTLKLTRDAEIDLDDDLSESFIRKMSKGLEKRKAGAPVRFVYDQTMPTALRKFLVKKIGLDKSQSDFIPGGRYHNFKDFMAFPEVGPAELWYQSRRPLPHPEVRSQHSLLKGLAKHDALVHFPYQSFNSVIDVLREASIDPRVSSIKITLYRVAKNSNVINALIAAAKNGKRVTVVMELQARFDEQANIYWSERLRREGVRVIHGVPDLKVHAKLILITRRGKSKKTRFASVGTGNFNEATARVYTDHSLFTADKRITGEVAKVFDFLENTYRVQTFKHLLVSPFNMRRKLVTLLNTEIKNAQAGKPAYAVIKLNNLTDLKMVRKLYQASRAGVPIRLMVRGMYSAVSGDAAFSQKLQARGIVDRYLEHTRLLLFANGGNERVYVTSADWMPRNLDRRVEVAAPVFDEGLRADLRQYLDLQWQDTAKARVLDGPELLNEYYRPEGAQLRSQDVQYEILESRLTESERRAAKEEPEELAELAELEELHSGGALRH